MKRAGLLAFVLCAACATPSQFQSARVLSEGETRVGIVGQVHSRQDGFGGADPRTQLTYELHLRQGVVEDQIDCGGKIYAVGLKADCKFQLWQSSWLDVAAIPGIGFTSSLVGAHLLDGYSSFVLGLNVFREPEIPGAVSLVGSYTIVGRCFVAEGRPSSGCFAQWGVSGGIHVTLGGGFALMPEISSMRNVGLPIKSFGSMNGPWIQAGVALLFHPTQ